MKTNKVDAEVLAQRLRCDYLRSVWQPDEPTQRLTNRKNRSGDHGRRAEAGHDRALDAQEQRTASLRSPGSDARETRQVEDHQAIRRRKTNREITAYGSGGDLSRRETAAGEVTRSPSRRRTTDVDRTQARALRRGIVSTGSTDEKTTRISVQGSAVRPSERAVGLTDFFSYAPPRQYRARASPRDLSRQSLRCPKRSREKAAPSGGLVRCGAPSIRLFLIGLRPRRARLRFTGRLNCNADIRRFDVRA